MEGKCFQIVAIENNTFSYGQADVAVLAFLMWTTINTYYYYNRKISESQSIKWYLVRKLTLNMWQSTQCHTDIKSTYLYISYVYLYAHQCNIQSLKVKYTNIEFNLLVKIQIQGVKGQIFPQGKAKTSPVLLANGDRLKTSCIYTQKWASQHI